jgi:hypothetical protein
MDLSVLKDMNQLALMGEALFTEKILNNGKIFTMKEVLTGFIFTIKHSEGIGINPIGTIPTELSCLISQIIL